jgi:uncharacterized protein YraI
MHVRNIVAAAALVAAFAVPTIAEAAVGHTTSSVRLRTGPGSHFPSITTIPRGATVDVGSCSSWCRVSYHGRSGFVSAGSVTTRVMPPPGFHRPPPPRSGFHTTPRWDDHYHAWYDGKRWYFGGRWYDQPKGFGFGMSFGH